MLRTSPMSLEIAILFLARSSTGHDTWDILFWFLCCICSEGKTECRCEKIDGDKKCSPLLWFEFTRSLVFKRTYRKILSSAKSVLMYYPKFPRWHTADLATLCLSSASLRSFSAGYWSQTYVEQGFVIEVQYQPYKRMGFVRRVASRHLAELEVCSPKVHPRTARHWRTARQRAESTPRCYDDIAMSLPIKSWLLHLQGTSWYYWYVQWPVLSMLCSLDVDGCNWLAKWSWRGIWGSMTWWGCVLVI